MRRLAVAGLLLALLGGTIIGLSDTCTWREGLSCPPFSLFLQGKAFWGNLLALIGALTVTGYLMIGRRIRAKMSLVPYIFAVYGVAAITLIILMLASGGNPFGYSATTYLWMLLLALVPQLIGHSTYNWALRFLPAAFVAVTTLGEPIGSTILAFIILKESPSLLQFTGGAFILAGIILVSRSERDITKEKLPALEGIEYEMD